MVPLRPDDVVNKRTVCAARSAVHAVVYREATNGGRMEGGGGEIGNMANVGVNQSLGHGGDATRQRMSHAWMGHARPVRAGLGPGWMSHAWPDRPSPNVQPPYTSTSGLMTFPS